MGWSLLEKTIDPVCGKRINPVKAGIAAIHKGHSFYFCSRQCWASFQEAPTQFTAVASTAPKNWWSRYLQRLDRATGGKPPCCQ